MQNFLTEKLMLDTKHGRDCTLEVCIAGEPDADRVIFKGTCGDCLRKISTHKLAYGGDEYFSLYTNEGNYCGTSFDDVSWQMGIIPDALRATLRIKPSLEEQIQSAANEANASHPGMEPSKVPEVHR